MIDVRKERISDFVFGISIPNADTERVIAYHRKAEGKVTARDIAKAWKLRDPTAEQLSFKFRGEMKRQYIFVNCYFLFLILGILLGAHALIFDSSAQEEAIALISVSVLSLIFVVTTSQCIFIAARLAKLEKKNGIQQHPDVETQTNVRTRPKRSGPNRASPGK